MTAALFNHLPQSSVIEDVYVPSKHSGRIKSPVKWKKDDTLGRSIKILDSVHVSPWKYIFYGHLLN